MPDPRKPFIVEADASKYASGAILRQQDTNGDWHPCAYLLKWFNETERNYDIADRELLDIIRVLTDWRHYLIGSPHKVTILTDHNNLRYFRTAQKLNRQQARWSLFLSEFDLNLVHVLGQKWYSQILYHNDQTFILKKIWIIRTEFYYLTIYSSKQLMWNYTNQ
jgi:hypothetical protein